MRLMRLGELDKLAEDFFKSAFLSQERCPIVIEIHGAKNLPEEADYISQQMSALIFPRGVDIYVREFNGTFPDSYKIKLDAFLSNLQESS